MIRYHVLFGDKGHYYYCRNLSEVFGFVRHILRSGYFKATIVRVK